MRTEKEMREQRPGIKLNRGGYLKEAPRLWKIARAAGMRKIVLALALLWGGPFTLFVKAEQATLRSPDATVYEQTSEGSNPVGNLVEGGSFEYIGDVTAEDGSVWHQVTIAGGATGYIKGDREIETGEEGPAPEGGQEAPAGEGGGGEGGGEPPQANLPERESSEGGSFEGNPPGEDVEAGQNSGEAEAGMDRELPEGNDGEDREAREASQDVDDPSEEDAGDDSEEEEAVPAFHMQNTQAKKYVMEGSQKVKERGSHVQMEMAIDREEVTGRRTGIDLPLAAAIVVVFLCGGTIYICWRRIKRMRKGRGEAVGSMPEGNKPKAHRKAERKKHSQKKKSTRIIQGKKRI